jgi:hypothetical protein
MPADLPGLEKRQGEGMSYRDQKCQSSPRLYILNEVHYPLFVQKTPTPHSSFVKIRVASDV